MVTPSAILEQAKPEPIAYKRGNVCTQLKGFHAGLYRGMIWKYGETEATERFWWLWHKKSDCLSPETAAQSL